MVKLFGWEDKMNIRIAEKRDKELDWTKIGQILTVISDNLKYVRWTLGGICAIADFLKLPYSCCNYVGNIFHFCQ